MARWRLFYHITWSTKNRELIIQPHHHQSIQGTIRAAAKNHGALVHAVGIMPDHIHVVASIPPSVALSVVIGELKGKSSRALNALFQEETGATFAWQSEYGLLSFGESALKRVVEYAKNQVEHHTSNRLLPGLEHDGGPTVSRPPKSSSSVRRL
jgi:putative transposase